MSKKKFNEAEFKEFCKEAIPHIEALQKLLEDRDMENLGSLNFSADGYVTFSVYDTGWELGRLRKGEFTMRHEIGLEESMKTLDVKTNYRTYKECFLRVERYWHDGSISLTIWNQNDGCVARVTTCLVDHSLREDEAYVDANNCPWAVAFLEKNGFAKRTGKKRRSGYCEYPLMKFDTTKMLMYEEVR